MLILFEDGGVLDTDDFVMEFPPKNIIEKCGDMLKTGYEYDTDQDDKVVVAYKIGMDSRRDYYINVIIGVLNRGTLLMFKDTTRYYPSVSIWYDDNEKCVRISVSFHDKHYFREDVGLDFERVIKVYEDFSISDTKKYFEREY